MSEEVRNQANQILNWLDKAKFHDEDRALRAIQKIQQGPEVYIDPELDVKENYNIIKNRLNLVTKNERYEGNVSTYEDMASRRFDKKMEEDVRPDQGAESTGTPNIERLELPSYVWAINIDSCFEEPWNGARQIGRPDNSCLDKQPPNDSSHKYWLSTKNLALSTKLRQAIETISTEEEHGEAESQRRLHRKGVGEVLEIISDDILPDRKAELAEYREAAKHAGAYVGGDSVGYTELDETISFQHTFKRRKSDSFRVVWWQQDAFEWIGEQIGVSENDAFRWSLVRGALAWHEAKGLPEPLADDLELLSDTFESQARAQASAYSRAFIVTMNEAFEQGYGSDVLEWCVEKSPTLAHEYVENIHSKMGEMARIDLDVLPIALSKHLLDVLDRFERKFSQFGPSNSQIVVDGEIRYIPPSPGTRKLS